MSDSYVKVPCKHCPFRRDVTPFLHPERAEEIACTADNPYSSFACHKTLEYDDDEGDTVAGGESMECAGRLSMMAYSGYPVPEGFKASDLVYSDTYEMIEAYEIEWDDAHARRVL